MWNESGEATYMAGSVVDITERKLAEIRVRRLNRLYAVLSGINALVVRVGQRDDLFREATRIAVETGRFHLAWIGLTNMAEKRLKVLAWHGVGSRFIERMPLALEPDAQGRLSVPARAVLERSTLVVEDVATDNRIIARQALLDEGLHSFAILPLLVAGEVVGAIGLYAAEARFFDATEMKLLLELASDIAFAMDHIEKADRLTRNLADFAAVDELRLRLGVRIHLVKEGVVIGPDAPSVAEGELQ